MPMTLSRRRVLSAIGLAGTGALAAPRVLAAEARLETTTVRLAKIPVICFAPQYVCEDLLRMEGFTDIRYVDTKTISAFGQGLAEGRYDFASNRYGAERRFPRFRPADHARRRHPCRVLRVVCQRRHPQHP